MALATQCPYCHTAFRVANDQLKLHAGLVRCGACQQTFNGIEHLLAPGHTSPVAPPLPPEPTPTRPPVAPTQSTESAGQASNAEPAANDLPDSIDSTDSTDSSSTIADVDSTALLQENLPDAASSSLEFDLGDDNFLDNSRVASDEDRTIGQLALQTQATLMNQSDSDWSVSEPQSSDSKDLREQMHPVWAEQTSISDFTADTSAEDTAPDEHNSTHETKTLELPAFSETSVTDDISKDASASESTSEIESSSESSSESSDDDTPDFVMHAEQKQRRGKYLHRLLILFTLILLLSLLAQSAYSLRNPIAAWFPQSKPLLLNACQFLHCQIQLPAQIESISIESNELQTLATDQNVFSLAIQLQNKSNTLQSWPMLELILNDRKDKPVLRRVFTPNDYLPGKNDIAKGFTPGSEQTIKLYFELSSVKAAGYHVGVFYP